MKFYFKNIWSRFENNILRTQEFGCKECSEVKSKIGILTLLVVSVTLNSCKKLVEINPPTNSITSSQVFADDADANSAVLGIYSKLINTSTTADFGSGATTIYLGTSADELLPFRSAGDQFSNNTLQSNNNIAYARFWRTPYSLIYQCNAILDGLSSSNKLSSTKKDQLSGEAKFLRAYINFYLVNLFGDIPLLNTSNYKTNTAAPRTSVMQVYQSIISDLKDAQSLLPADYSTGGGERIRANQWAATALLARTYLYYGNLTEDATNYTNAITQATSVINNTSLYTLVGDLNGVFLKNSTESILQWQVNSSLATPLGNGIAEGFTILPFPNQPPGYYLSSQLLGAFEAGDQRKAAWVDSTISAGKKYFYPYKYTVKYGAANDLVNQYYMVLRLAEQYLIRAEAEANGEGNGPNGAIADLNVIRSRAGLPNLPSSLTPNQILDAVAQERRIELFAEWGHRWLDLKRSGQAHNVLSIIPYKQPWSGDYQLLYPIAVSELTLDPNLKENPGY